MLVFSQLGNYLDNAYLYLYTHSWLDKHSLQVEKYCCMEPIVATETKGDVLNVIQKIHEENLGGSF